MFAGEEFAGAIEAGEDFVEDEEGVKFIAKLPEASEEGGMDGAFPSASLNRFDEDGANGSAGEVFFDLG